MVIRYSHHSLRRVDLGHYLNIQGRVKRCLLYGEFDSEMPCECYDCTENCQCNNEYHEFL